MAAVCKKFSHVLIVHSQDISIWRALRSQIEQQSILFWLQADYSLYQMGDLQKKENTEVQTLPHEVLSSMFTESKIVNIQNKSQIVLVNIVRKALEEKLLSRVLFVEADESGKTAFETIATELRLGAVLEGKTSLKDSIHEIQPNLFVLPGSTFSGKETFAKVTNILQTVSKNFSYVIVSRGTSTYPQVPKHHHVILDKKGVFRSMEETIKKL